MKSVIDLLFPVEDIRVYDKIKEVIFKVVTVIFPAFNSSYTVYLLVISSAVYIIQALLIGIYSIHFAFRSESMCRSKRIVAATAAVIKDHRITYTEDRREDLCTFRLIYFSILYHNSKARSFNKNSSISRYKIKSVYL